MFIDKFDTSPTIGDIWDVECTPEEDAKILGYDNDKNNVRNLGFKNIDFSCFVACRSCHPSHNLNPINYWLSS